MRIQLYDFQKDAVKELLDSIDFAHAGLKLREQIVTFAAPTGAGKTVMLTAMMEHILCGTADRVGDPDAVFVWLSDSPELNEQSRQKIVKQSDRIRPSKLIIVDDSFDREQFAPGTVNFINTGKLGKDKLLTTKSDRRMWTFWNTLENTAKAHPEKLYVIIDEAHHGMRMTARLQNEARTIAQKFLLGSKEDELSRMPLVIGVSATIERFRRLADQCPSTLTPVEVSPVRVTDSGLLKDTIILHIPELGIGSVVENSLLKAAAINWLDKCQQWEDYCLEEGEEVVKPVFVIQVQDGRGNKVTETDLQQCVQTIEEARGGIKFKEGEVVHTFNDVGPIDMGNFKILPIDPSDIQSKTEVQVVFFKMNLSTGWDCPRAETMMSYRDAQDPTYIAQLLGRMIRTPLARRVADGYESLNDVALYLPYFDKTASENVIKALKDELPDKIVITRGQVAIPRNDKYADAFKVAERIHTTIVLSSSKEGYRTNAVKLARALAQDGIDRKASKTLNTRYVEVVEARIVALKKSGKMAELQAKALGVGLDLVTFDYASGSLLYRSNTDEITMSQLDLWGNYNKAAKVLGENIAKTYWQRHAKEGSIDLRMDIIGFVADIDSMTELEQIGAQEFHRLEKDNFAAICALGDERKQHYYRLLGKSDDPREVPMGLPSYITYAEMDGATDYEKHIYARISDEKAAFALNPWENGVVNEELKAGAYCWLRNLDRKPWSLSVPYQGSDGKTAVMYPDIIVFRKCGEVVRPSILEPHDGSRADNYPKAVGLARYAQKHLGEFDRIQLIRQQNGPDMKQHFYRLDFCDTLVRDKVLAAHSNAALDTIFDEFAKADV